MKVRNNSDFAVLAVLVTDNNPGEWMTIEANDWENFEFPDRYICGILILINRLGVHLEFVNEWEGDIEITRVETILIPLSQTGLHFRVALFRKIVSRGDLYCCSLLESDIQDVADEFEYTVDFVD
ncbi:hypothetical protein IW140_005237 [Coemansia sp. RSA 1813]|nr:hypothetical protein EV178_005633 [Coemansia sp. RSA 1646]KAJ1768420.1 hypothetical protein LPJ74_004874 [Coemansia sp. RSA 1843]KAJ2090134.1 hypothetical protein IW138_002944 [Coemansia sp. RSA 986]KAJ2214211.1 hypothetical protein EV179_003231 [Coemansia sp. RSA 487]KAJ2565652.1 hypothetical protein IW140_005237 [Coemansia sp. RSA 1813]